MFVFREAKTIFQPILQIIFHDNMFFDIMIKLIYFTFSITVGPVNFFPKILHTLIILL